MAVSRPPVGGQDGNQDHGADAALKANAGWLFCDFFQRLTALVRLWQESGDGIAQQLAAERQLGFAMAVGKKSEVTDTLETGRQDVNEKTPDELSVVKGHDFERTLVPVILPLERDLAIIIGDQPVVGDGDAVGVAAQIFKRLLRPPKGGLA